MINRSIDENMFSPMVLAPIIEFKYVVHEDSSLPVVAQRSIRTLDARDETAQFFARKTHCWKNQQKNQGKKKNTARYGGTVVPTGY